LTETRGLSAPQVAEQNSEVVQIRYSHYWPPLGPPSCADWRDGICFSDMASGLPWYNWQMKAAACPPSWPFWTKITLGAQTFYCLDRGGKVQYVNGIPWVDFMVPYPHYGYGTLVDVRVKFPEEVE